VANGTARVSLDQLRQLEWCVGIPDPFDVYCIVEQACPICGGYKSDPAGHAPWGREDIGPCWLTAAIKEAQGE